MFSLRRYAVYIALAAAILVTLNYFRSDISQAKQRYSSQPPPIENAQDEKYWLDASGASEVHANTREFNWSSVHQNFPVKGPYLRPPNTGARDLPKVQFEFPAETAAQAATRKERQAAVRQTFEKGWKAYREHAWLKDELSPLSGGSKDGYGGWAASLVDNLDNLWIMGFKEEFESAVAAAVKIDLASSTTETINVFETTIRHLGGFLACYDLSKDQRCLTKAIEFGDMLYKAFDTPNRMPITRWKPIKSLRDEQEADPVVLVAEIGSLTMEFTRLTLVSRDPKYYDAAHRITREFQKQQMDTLLPGMWPVVVDARKPDFTKDTFFTLGAMSDSLYEYFPKMFALTGGIDGTYGEMYNKSMETAMKHNLYRPMTPGSLDILFSGGVRAHEKLKPVLDPSGQHLVCFAGGMFALGGKIFKEPSHVDIGMKLTEGCIWAYQTMPLGIMPEVFTLIPCEGDIHAKPCEWSESRWAEEVNKHQSDLQKVHLLPKGFASISDTRYILRPEAIESIFILYRITGAPHLLDAAWNMFQSIVNITSTPLANAAVSDVTWSHEDLAAGKAGEGGIQVDSMESFWMAETLKYFYLIFSETSVISLDEWVFNTEAHPFKRFLPDAK